MSDKIQKNDKVKFFCNIQKTWIRGVVEELCPIDSNARVHVRTYDGRRASLFGPWLQKDDSPWIQH